MSDIDKLKNILAFLCILFGEDFDVMELVFQMSPEYILEKYNRYIRSDTREWPWGMHPSLKRGYFMKWLKDNNVELSEDKAENW